MRKIADEQRGKKRKIHAWMLGGLLAVVAGLFLGKISGGAAFTPATFAHKYYFYGFPVDSLKGLERQYAAESRRIGRACELYEQKDFEALAPVLAQLQAHQPAERAFIFYAGLTAHYLKNRDAALAAFLPLSETKGNFQQPARWYAALTYTLFNEPENAIKWLETIDKGPYHEKAKALIADLK